MACTMKTLLGLIAAGLFACTMLACEQDTGDSMEDAAEESAEAMEEAADETSDAMEDAADQMNNP